MALIKCSECGKEFSDKAGACPNCACPVEVKDTEEKEYESPNPIAITGFVLSLVSIFVQIFWIIVGATGLIFSIIGVIITFKEHKKGKILAILGVILGIVGIILGLSFWDRFIELFRG